MKIIRKLEKAKTIKEPVVLTLGYFDGLHLGHQAVLNRVITKANKNGQQSAVLTFSNHPSTILRPERPTQNLFPCEHKIRLIEQIGINLLILIPFGQQIAQMTAKQFLSNLLNIIPFTSLILGHDARIGYQRKGNREAIERLGLQHGFEVEYLQPYTIEGEIVSSTLIRQYIAQKNLQKAVKLLGHPL